MADSGYVYGSVENKRADFDLNFEVMNVMERFVVVVVSVVVPVPVPVPVVGEVVW